MKGTERTISIVTGTRAEFGLLSPVIESILADKSLQLQLIVTGAHLCAEYGSTVSEIESAGFPISLSLDILEDSKNTPVYRATAAALDGLAEFWSDNRPDIVVLLGDRYEAFAAAAAAAICGIPIAHIGGGDVTEGAKDEFFRHCITKMSTLHFPICARSRLRIIQLGENPKSVFCAGSLGSQNIERYGSIPAIELSERCGLDAERPFLLCTYHPETQGDGNPAQCVRELLFAIEDSGIPCLFTAANADDGGAAINAELESYCALHDNAVFVKNLGARLYICALRLCSAVIGNSSSAVVEAPVLHKPAVNIGDRQSGREMGEGTICCVCSRKEILQAIETALSPDFARRALCATNPYSGGDVAGKIVSVIKQSLDSGICAKKSFYDMDFEVEV